jgi:hypothetical protein
MPGRERPFSCLYAELGGAQAASSARSGKLWTTTSAEGSLEPGGATHAVARPRAFAGMMSRSRLSPAKSTLEPPGRVASAR